MCVHIMLSFADLTSIVCFLVEDLTLKAGVIAYRLQVCLMGSIDMDQGQAFELCM
jgi:hypothetical protein